MDLHEIMRGGKVFSLSTPFRVGRRYSLSSSKSSGEFAFHVLQHGQTLYNRTTKEASSLPLPSSLSFQHYIAKERGAYVELVILSLTGLWPQAKPLPLLVAISSSVKQGKGKLRQ